MRRPAAAALALLCASALPVALAQEEVEEAAVPAAPPDVPLPALPATLAAKARLLDLAQVGSRLVAVGEQGVIVLSDDGSNWRQVEKVPVSVMLTRLRFLDDKLGWAVGYDASILHTQDGGRSWVLQHRDPKARALFDVLFLDAQNGIAVGGYGSYYSTADGGKNWQLQNFPLTQVGQHFSRLLRLEDGTLFMAGERGMLARSADGGANWQMLQSPYVGSFFGALALGGNRVLAFGMRGNVFVTDDLAACPVQDPAKFDLYSATGPADDAQLAATGWRRVQTPNKESLFGGTTLESGEAMLVGFNGITLISDAAATQLTPVRTQAEQTLIDLTKYKNRLIAVGKLGAQELREIK